MSVIATKWTRRLSAVLLALGLAGLACGTAAAADWPTRPIRLVVPFPPGGGTDLVARAVAKSLGTTLGQPVVVENKPGAGGTLGSHVVAMAPPDGYTLGIATSSTHVTSAILMKDTPYNPLTSFAPVSEIGSTGYVLAITPNFPAPDMKAFIAYLRQHPGTVEYASVGPTTLGYLITKMLELDQKVSMTHVPYKGASQAYTDLMSGVVKAFFDNPVASAEYVKAGKLRALAVTQRTDLLPDTPSFAEVGIPGFDAVFWYGIVAPAGTPPAVVQKIQAGVAQFAGSEEGKAVLGRLGVEPMGSTPQAFAKQIGDDIATWKAVADRAHIVAD
ncbi:Bug family tripartite tricarboxylate transporter substrate binding protein [Achromobacter aloeverae]|uniref:Tripartite tricarboxylate transporter substrate binding protein n=1 Tax=Achromobacter aloeverae TaxID=1750518 RepID=A0A4Q1HCH0_9BURK|nr:tripartite tricarboxylate transporter substrate binding protein [Achromobacter aloeverae]RXN83253.1 hypothetical protein C7R54_27570 [Achromobacter aloeverae]